MYQNVQHIKQKEECNNKENLEINIANYKQQKIESRENKQTPDKQFI